MTSYKKLKIKCDYLQNQVNMFKNALTVVKKAPEVVKEYDAASDILDSFITTQYAILENAIWDERIRESLTRWVANNIDRERIMKILDVKESLLVGVLKRFLTDDTVWKDLKFGTDGNGLYIDGVVHYESEEEKRLIKELAKNDKRD